MRSNRILSISIIVFLMVIVGLILFKSSLSIQTSGEERNNQNINKNVNSKIIPGSKNQNLEDQINRIIKQYPKAIVRVVFYDLYSNETINIQGNEPILAASLIKLPILVASLSAKYSNNYDYTSEIIIKNIDKVKGTGILHYVPDNELINEKVNLNLLNYLMITKSDNTATNIIIDKLDINWINNFFREKLSLKNTKLTNKLMRPELTNISCISISNCNYLTLDDIAYVLKTIYFQYKKQTLLGQESMFILSHQCDRKGIPSALPNTYSIYNKTGTLTASRYDAAIIEKDNKAYVLVIAVSNYDPKAANNIIKDITQAILL